MKTMEEKLKDLDSAVEIWHVTDEEKAEMIKLLPKYDVDYIVSVWLESLRVKS